MRSSKETDGVENCIYEFDSLSLVLDNNALSR
jgi:hypothetical protein